MAKKRCGWAESDPLYITYHDKEWGKPVKNDLKLFAMLQLEGMQAGLSWITILKKRTAITEAFADFDPEKLIRYTDKKCESLLKNENIIRSKTKIRAVVNNAKIFNEHFSKKGSFSRFLWSFVNHAPIINHPKQLADLPAQTEHSAAMAKALKKLGFSFVGPTICYAFMQATGMVDDHVVDCWRKQR